MAASTPLGWSLEEQVGLGFLFRARGPMPPPDAVSIVALDRASAATLGLPEQLRDWPRAYHARLIDRLTGADAALIAYDVNFHQVGDAHDDQALADAIERSRRVLLFEYTRANHEDVAVGDDQAVVEVAIERRREPLPAFADAAVATSPFPLPKVPARISQFWAFKPGIDYRPTLPAIALQQLAQPGIPAWIDLLEQVNGTPLPASLSAAYAQGDLERVMITTRRWIQEQPARARAIADMAPRALAPDQQRLIDALVRLYTEPDAHYLNFYGPPGHFQILNFAALIDDQGDGLDLTGHVVFVGQLELSGQERDDDFLTVFSRADGINLSGVEIAATALGNLLDGTLIEPASPAIVWPALLIFGLVIGLIATLLPAWLVVPAVLCIALGYGFGAYLAFERHQLWLPLATPLGLQVPLGVLAGLLIQHREVQQARRNLSTAVRYYLPAKVTAHLAETPFDPDLASETIYGACMVTDAQGFTTISERLKPEELKRLLDDYFECLFEPAQRYGGVVTDVVGDGMTCVWTANTPDRGCRTALVQAAMLVQARTASFNRQHQPIMLPTRMGLHAGPLMIGNVGGAGHLRYTIVGDVVNTAARLEQLNKQLGTFILITDEAVLDLGEEVVVRPLGAFRLVGKQDVVRINELLGPADSVCDPTRLDRFAEALSFYQSGTWQKAHRALDRFLQRYPDDGAAAFYRDRAARNLTDADVADDPGIIQLERK